jgi:hypothetical protein
MFAIVRVILARLGRRAVQLANDHISVGSVMMIDVTAADIV